MQKKFFLLCCAALLSSNALLFSMDRVEQARALFSLEDPGLTGRITVDPAVFSDAVTYALYFFRSKNRSLVETEFMSRLITAEDTKQTLEFFQTILGDSPEAISNPRFLEKHFEFVRWQPDHPDQQGEPTQSPDERLFLKHYATHSCQGSPRKTALYCRALYSIVHDDFDPSQFTKQDVLGDNVLESNPGVEPIVWVRHEDLNKILQNGSLFVTLDDRTILVNANKNNRRPYRQEELDFERQERYFYYKLVREDGDIGERRHHTLLSLKKVLLAGNRWDLGLGKVILLRRQDPASREFVCSLHVLADWGGSLKANFHQLNQYEGTLELERELDLASLPQKAEAYILKIKHREQTL